MVDEIIMWLTDKIDDNPVGGKAKNLAKMIQLGFPVPKGFVITEEKLSAATKNKIVKNFRKLLEEYQSVSVRSSANFEDSERASFTGVFKTSLWVKDEKKLISSIRECLNSAKNQNTRIYCEKHEMKPEEIKMSVIVQGMIDADKSGVIFTKNILENGNSSLMIEVSKGIGSNVVDGTGMPSRFVVDKLQGNILEKNVNDADLADEDILCLVRFAELLEKHFESPQDIEWAMKENEIYLLQSRPITR